MRFRLAVPVALAALLVAGCTNDAYHPDTLRSDLRDDGLSAEQAACVVRSMRLEYGSTRLAERAQPSNEERAAFDAILDECVRGADPSS